MRHGRPLDFDALEARKLLTKAHPAVHSVPAVIITPVALNGTLTVDNKAASSSMDAYGDSTTTIPVSGTISTLGAVKGVWNESEDSTGNYLAPDTLKLRNAQGAIVITFNSAVKSKVHRLTPTTLGYDVAQRLYAGTRAYTKDSESGTLEMITNNAQNAVKNITLTSSTP